MTWAGVGPSGSFATINTDLGSLRLDWESARGDVSGLIDNLLVVAIQGNTVSSQLPSSGNVLLFDGSQWFPGNATASGISHNLLSVIHDDTIPASPNEGDIISGSGTPASWVRFPIGQPGQNLRVSDSGSLVWSFRPLDIISSGVAVNLTPNSRRIVINKTSGSPTQVNLPVSPIFGQEILIKDGAGDAETNNITVSVSGNTIDGFPSIVMSRNYQSFDFLYNGTEWNIV